MTTARWQTFRTALRFLTATFPAVLVPLGADGGLRGPDEATATETVERRVDAGAAGGRGLGLAGLPAADATELDVSPDRAPVQEAHDRGAPSGVSRSASGLAPLGVDNRIHLARCGHDAGRLDLPPPSRT